MSTQVIKTRIQNKIDSFSNWQSINPVLLKGEIATVKVTTQQIDANTGNVVNVPAYLIKVGDVYPTGHEKAGQGIPFNELPWLSAKASDVYPWAKVSKAEDVKIEIGSATSVEEKTLKAWFESIQDSLAEHAVDIAANTGKLPGHTDVAINTLIDTKLATLDSTVSGSGSVVTGVTQADGKVTVTKGTLAAADIPELAASKIVVAAVTGDSAKVTLDAKLGTIDTELASIAGAISGGVHFIGVAKKDTNFAATSNGSTAVSISIKTGSTYTSHVVAAGDLVIKEDSSVEYIWTGTAWQELGDQSLLGQLSTSVDTLDKAIKALDVTDTAAANKFVTAVAQTDGKITVSRAQPTAADVKYDDSNTVATKVAAIDAKVDVTKVSTAISTAINALDHTTNGSGDFVTAVTQTDGKVTVTKGNLPAATTSVAGIVKLNNTTTSTATNEAATANIVHEVSVVASGAAQAVASLEENCLRYDAVDKHMYVGATNASTVIFDCGGASDIDDVIED